MDLPALESISASSDKRSDSPDLEFHTPPSPSAMEGWMGQEGGEGWGDEEILYPALSSGDETLETSFGGDDDPWDESDTASLDEAFQSLSFSQNTPPPEDPLPVDDRDEFQQYFGNRSPLCDNVTWDHGISVGQRYELLRASESWGTTVGEMLQQGGFPPREYDGFRRWVRSHQRWKWRGPIDLPSREAWKVVMTHENWLEPSSQRSVILSGRLNDVGCRDGHFRLSLQPLKLDPSCRLYRCFGSDRFLTVTLPAAGEEPCRCQGRTETIARWLVRSEHRILGRVWKPFYIDEAKDPGHKIHHKIHFFAVSGDGLNRRSPGSEWPVYEHAERRNEISVEELMDWIVPLGNNSSQQDCALFYRMRLALSATIATEQLQPSQVVRVDDIKLDGKVMNDGCSKMSRSLGRRIATILGCKNYFPSCYQGRIGGAKGVWIVDKDDMCHYRSAGNLWIEISNSQLKVRHHHQDSVPDSLNKWLYQFEVIQSSGFLREGRLSKQFLMVLEHQKVPRATVSQLLVDHMDLVSDGLTEAVVQNDRNYCKSILPQLGVLHQSRYNNETWPNHDLDRAAILLDSGFEPLSCEYLVTALRRSLQYKLERCVEKLQIPVPCSTSTYCIADPYGVLEPDEIHLSFSQTWGEHFQNLDGHDVLVSRHPALRPCDIQKRKVVVKHELQHLVDVAVFPTTGSQPPLAEILSGGDYDGDRVWVCWDRGIVGSFQNTEPPGHEYDDQELHLSRRGSLVTGDSYDQEFWRPMFEFYLEPSMVGICTNIHEQCCHDMGMSSQASQVMAALTGQLLGGKKSGVSLSMSSLNRLRKQVHAETRKPKDPNLIEYLEDIARRQMVANLTKFHARYQEFKLFRNDQGILSMADKLLPKQSQSSSSPCGQSDSLHHALDELHQQVKRIREDIWTKNAKANYPLAVKEVAQAIQELTPKRFDHPLSVVWEYSHHEWDIARAACIYSWFMDTNFSWCAVGHTLCRMKAQSCSSFTIRSDTLTHYRFDSNSYKRLLSKERDTDDEDSWPGSPEQD